MDQPDTIRNQLLAAAGDGSVRPPHYEREINTMLADLEKKVRFERRIVIAQWLFIVLLTTAFNVIGGYKHETMTGMWFSLQGIFWFLFGAVFLLMARFSQMQFELLKEIKRVELTALEVKEQLATKMQ
jgi:hypothetical protein